MQVAVSATYLVFDVAVDMANLAEKGFQTDMNWYGLAVWGSFAILEAATCGKWFQFLIDFMCIFSESRVVHVCFWQIQKSRELEAPTKFFSSNPNPIVV